jgi:hypothetical protein
MTARRSPRPRRIETEGTQVMNKLHLLAGASLALTALALANGAEAGMKELPIANEASKLTAASSAVGLRQIDKGRIGPILTNREYTFTLNSFRITDTRSVHNDTDFVAMAVAVGNGAPIVLPTRPMGDLNNGTYQVSMSIPNVPVGDKQAVAFSYSIVNSGYDQNAVEQALKKAVSEGAQKAAEAGAVAAAQSIGVDPATAKAIEEAVGPSLIEKLVNVVFADCDGPVAAGKHVYSGAQLAAATANGAVLSATDNNPGIDSPTGCGGNSRYYVSWSIKGQNSQPTNTTPVGSLGGGGGGDRLSGVLRKQN